MRFEYTTSNNDCDGSIFNLTYLCLYVIFSETFEPDVKFQELTILSPDRPVLILPIPFVLALHLLSRMVVVSNSSSSLIILFMALDTLILFGRLE